MTISPTLTLSPAPSLTDTPIPVVKLNVMIATCDTGLDIFHNLGEVTSAQEVRVKAEKASCSSRLAQEDIINQLGKLFVVRKIVKP